MKELLEELLAALADLLQCGAASFPPESAARLLSLAEECESTGLHTGAKLFREIHGLLQRQRHEFSPDPLPLAGAVSQAVEYLRLWRKKLALDAVENKWKEETEEEA